MAKCTFRGVDIWDETTNGVAYDLDAAPVANEVVIKKAPSGDGEFAKGLGKSGADVTLSLTYRAADNGLPTIYGILEAMQGLPRGTLVTPEQTLPNCIVASPPAPSNPQRVILQNGNPGWLLEVQINFRRSA